MWLPILVCYLGTLAFSVFGISYHIKLRRLPPYVGGALLLAVFIPLSIVFLLPADHVAHNTKHLPLFLIADDAILYLWKSNYWTTFLLTWLILPVLQEFYRLGHHNKWDRFRDALKRNAKFQLIVAGMLVVAVIYLVIESGLSFGHVKLMIIAISHIYSLVLALWLMAHGMISIPRSCWTSGSHIHNLNAQYLKVPRAVDNLEDVKISFKEDILQVLVLTKNFTSDSPENFRFRDWILDLYARIPLELREIMERQHLESSHTSITRDQLSNGLMTKLTASFNANLNKYIAYESEFNLLFEHVTQLEDTIDARLGTSKSLSYRFGGHHQLLNPRLNYVVKVFAYPVLFRVGSLLLFCALLIIVQSEFFHSTKLSLINTIVAQALFKVPLLQFFMQAVFFSYMLFCLLNSLTHLKIFNIYHLVPHNSDIVSACFYATYIARLTIPLSYNFITLFRLRKSIFEEWFGKLIHLTGLFNLMNNWLPRLVLIPVILTLFNVYDKLKKRLGITDLYDSWADFEDEEADASNRKDLVIVEAKRMINRELYKRQHSSNLRPFNLEQDHQRAANLNYEANRHSFNELLSNRIDEPQLDTRLDGLGNPVTGVKDFIGRIGGALSGFRPFRPYRDEPLESFDYDEDAGVL